MSLTKFINFTRVAAQMNSQRIISSFWSPFSLFTDNRGHINVKNSTRNCTDDSTLKPLKNFSERVKFYDTSEER